jgi:hypothetical protein
MMFIVSYLGFVSFLFFSFLAIVSFVLALLTNSFCQSHDLVAQILMCFYFLPLFELLISMNLSLIASFFKDIWSNLDLAKATSAFESDPPWLSSFEVSKSVAIFTRLCIPWVYFSFIGPIFLICLASPNSNIALNLRSYLGSLCLAFPLLALVRPIVISWFVFLFDRRYVILQDGDQQEQYPSKGSAVPLWLRVINADDLLHEILILFDSVDMLKDKSWTAFVCSPLTGFARPQPQKRWTWIASIIGFSLLIAVCVTDGIRMEAIQREQASMMRAVQREIEYVNAIYHLQFESIET